jgi:hypothetical protein
MDAADEQARQLTHVCDRLAGLVVVGGLLVAYWRLIGE